MPTRRARLRRLIYNRLPRWMKSHDFEAFAAFLAVASGLPILSGDVDPRSAEALLPEPLVLAWALVLVFGGIFIMVGLVLSSRYIYPRRVFWMRVEALGLTALAYFCYIYTVSILGTAPQQGWSASMLILGFGGVCHVREVAIQMEIEEYRLSLGLRERP